MENGVISVFWAAIHSHIYIQSLLPLPLVSFPGAFLEISPPPPPLVGVISRDQFLEPTYLRNWSTGAGLLYGRNV